MLCFDTFSAKKDDPGERPVSLVDRLTIFLAVHWRGLLIVIIPLAAANIVKNPLTAEVSRYKLTNFQLYKMYVILTRIPARRKARLGYYIPL